MDTFSEYQARRERVYRQRVAEGLLFAAQACAESAADECERRARRCKPGSDGQNAWLNAANTWQRRAEGGPAKLISTMAGFSK